MRRRSRIWRVAASICNPIRPASMPGIIHTLPPPRILTANPRIVGGAVDIGAYEFQSPLSVLPYAWLEQYGLPTDGSADFADTRRRRLEQLAGMESRHQPDQCLVGVENDRHRAPINNAPGIVVTWQSVSGITYYLQGSTNLSVQPAFSSIQSNIVGQAGTTSYTNTTATNGNSFFYRVGVQ